MATLDLNADPAREPFWQYWRRAISEFLHSGGTRGSAWTRLPPGAPLAVIVLCGVTYGAIMGAYNCSGERALMILYGAIKVPLLFLVTLLTAIPCFYVLNLLLGVGDDFRTVWRGLVDYQISVALQLFALAPVTLFVNFTNDDYRTALMWSTLLFAAAGWNARRSLFATYAQLIAKNPVHRYLRAFWFVLYAFIGIQMGWDLRPFVGSPQMPIQFFRDHFGNAYVETATIIYLFARHALNL